MSPHELHLHWKNKLAEARGQVGGGREMSIHDEQEICRLRSVNEELRLALQASEQKLKEAMQLLSEACVEDWANSTWSQRLANLQDRYYNQRD